MDSPVFSQIGDLIAALILLYIAMSLVHVA